MDAKTEKGHLVGYCSNKDGFKVHVPDKETVVVGRDIIFNEERYVLPTAEAESMSGIKTDTSSSISDEEDKSIVNENPIIPRLRNRKHIRQPQMLDYVLITVHDEPMSYTQAMASDNSQQWKAAMNDDMTLLVEHNTWQLVAKPEGRKVFDSK